MDRKVGNNQDNDIIKRQFLGHYLMVYNRYTGNEVGCIGNISENSLMLMTPWMVEIGAVFNFRIYLPEPLNGVTEVDFDAKCQWCHPDIDPREYDSGYTIVTRKEGYQSLLNALQRYFSFPDGEMTKKNN